LRRQQMSSDSEFDMLVEVPKGSRNKYELDEKSGRIRLDRELFTATRYPVEYGFIVDSLAEDSDPLDALAILDEPTFPGCLIRCRPIGIFWMRDEKGPDAKILSVPVWDQRYNWNELEQVPSQLLKEIRHFFDIYKDLEPGKKTEVGDWEGRRQAEEEIARCRKRFQDRH
jgi:inorganic pyrophosphatase